MLSRETSLGESQALQQVGYSHDKMIDLIIANPRVKQGALAAHFGYTEGWVSRVMSSDSFKLRMAQRRVELVDPLITASLEERFAALALRGTEVMQAKLDQPDTLVDFKDAAKAVEIGARGLAVGGFGAAKVEVGVNLDLRGALEAAQERRRERVVEQPVVGWVGHCADERAGHCPLTIDTEL